MAMQVCFHRWLSSKAVKPRRCTMCLLITLRCINRTPLDTRLLEMAVLTYPIGLYLSICIHATYWIPMDNTALWVQENGSTRLRFSTRPYLPTSPFPPTDCTWVYIVWHTSVPWCTPVHISVLNS